MVSGISPEQLNYLSVKLIQKYFLLISALMESRLLKQINIRKLSHLGHTLRKGGRCSKNEITQGMTSGRRNRGRPRARCMGRLQGGSK